MMEIVARFGVRYAYDKNERMLYKRTDVVKGKKVQTHFVAQKRCDTPDDAIEYVAICNKMNIGEVEIKNG